MNAETPPSSRSSQQPPKPNMVSEYDVDPNRWNNPDVVLRVAFQTYLISIVMEKAYAEDARFWEIVSDQDEVLAHGTQNSVELVQ